jgi:hemin uptake protein HemP
MRTLTAPMSRPERPIPATPASSEAAEAVRSEVMAVRRVSSAALLGDADRLIIEHQGRDYMLRRTANGKLILTA